MATRFPLVSVGGATKELPSGDTLDPSIIGVTSFSAGDLSPLFTTTETNPTTTPALAFALVNQNANIVYAGPGSGSAAAPAFRALVAADIPNLNTSILNAGTLPIVRGGTNASSFTSGQVTYFNGTALVGSSNCTWDNSGQVLAVTGQMRQGGIAGIPNGYLRTNTTGLASTTSLNPGIAVYGGGTGEAAYGMDLGYNATTSRYRNRLFMYGTAADFAFSASSDTPPTAQSGFTDLVVIRGDSGNVGINKLDPSEKLHVVGNGLFTGNAKIGGLRMLGYTTSTADPTESDLPNDKDFSVHRNTTDGTTFFAVNISGAIYAIEAPVI